MIRIGIRCLAIASLLSITAVRTSAQQGHVAGGYVVNAPGQLAGIGAHAVLGALHGFGIYADVKWTRGSPESRRGFTDALTAADAAELGDDLLRTDRVDRTVNIALTRALRTDAVAYLGAGRTATDWYLEYVDPLNQRGVGGLYTVRDDAARRARPNFLGGVFVRLTPHVWVQIGAESEPRGATVGGMLAIPLP